MCENKRYKAELIEHIKLIDSSEHANGRYLYPEKIDGDHFVVVSSRRVANLEYISTLAHECQHAIDLIGYCKDKCDGDFNKLLDEEMQREIFLWSEFNARKTGHRTYWLKIEKEIQRHTDASIEEKMRRNLSETFHRMNIYLSEGAGDSCLDDIVHELVGCFARISVYGDEYGIDLKDFPAEFMDAYGAFNDNKNMLDANMGEIRKAIESLTVIIEKTDER